ncbi:MAG: proline--tRNA ligase, partial [Microbacterium sp.]
MVTRLSNFFLRTLREDPADAEVTSHRLLVRAGYIRRAAPGVFTWLPLGLRVKAKIEAVIREEMANAGAFEVHFPALLPRDPYEASGRWTSYGDNIFRLQDRKGADYLLAPTHEEMFTLLVKDLYSSYKDLPLTIYQIQDKYRDEARPRAGLLRGREFTMKDAYSFDYTDEGQNTSYQTQRDAYERIFQRLGLEYVIVAADNGLMGGARSEEFLHPTPVGEDTFVRSAGGFAANVEAFTTVAPEPIPFDGLADPVIFDSPDTPTIETLVAHANAHLDGEFTAADTLKNVVLALTHLDG